MKETFERVADHLYRRQYNYKTTTGQWRTMFYGIFTDWQCNRQKVSLGTDLKTAKAGLTVRLADNVKKVDFNAQKQRAREEARRITLTQWGELYFSEMINPGLRSGPWQRSLFEKRLKPSPLGEMFLDEIDETALTSIETAVYVIR